MRTGGGKPREWNKGRKGKKGGPRRARGGSLDWLGRHWGGTRQTRGKQVRFPKPVARSLKGKNPVLFSSLLFPPLLHVARWKKLKGCLGGRLPGCCRECRTGRSSTTSIQRFLSPPGFLLFRWAFNRRFPGAADTSEGGGGTPGTGVVVVVVVAQVHDWSGVVA